MPPPTMHPRAARQSWRLHCNAKKLAPYLCDWENVARVWENPKECKEKRCMFESQQDEEKRKTRRRSADEPRSHPYYRPSYTTVGGGDNLGRTSPQSSRSQFCSTQTASYPGFQSPTLYNFALNDKSGARYVLSQAPRSRSRGFSPYTYLRSVGLLPSLVIAYCDRVEMTGDTERNPDELRRWQGVD